MCRCVHLCARAPTLKARMLQLKEREACRADSGLPHLPSGGGGRGLYREEASTLPDPAFCFQGGGSTPAPEKPTPGGHTWPSSWAGALAAGL